MSPYFRPILIILGVWLAAMAVGFWLDAPVARIAHRAAIDRDHFGNHIMKMAGDWRFTLAVALALMAWHIDSWRPAGLLALSGLLGGLLYTFVKWTAGRQRPVVLIDPYRFNPFVNGLRGFLDEPNMSFPSGHTTLAFATAGVLGITLPKWRYVFYALAAVVGAERVAENAHYVTDVIAGAGLGTLSAYLTYWVMSRIVPPGPSGLTADPVRWDDVPVPAEQPGLVPTPSNG
jgi:membrane-associated phospholipid phosphatase